MVGERRCSGKEFHVLGAATRKLHLPNSVLVDFTFNPTFFSLFVSRITYKLVDEFRCFGGVQCVTSKN